MAAKIVSPLTVHMFSFVYILNKTVSWKYPLFDDSHPKRHELVSDCGFDLDHTDDESCQAHFHVPISHLYVFFWGKKSISFTSPLEKGMANHSSILAWRIPWTEEPGRLQSMGSQRIGHDRVTITHSLTYPYWIVWFLVAFYEFLKDAF